MTRDEAIELMAAGMYGKGWNGPIDKMPGEKMKNVWRGYCANAFDALIAAGWPGPGSAKEARDAALEEAANWHDERAKIQCDLAKNSYHSGVREAHSVLSGHHDKSSAAIRALKG